MGTYTREKKTADAIFFLTENDRNYHCIDDVCLVRNGQLTFLNKRCLLLTQLI